MADLPAWGLALEKLRGKRSFRSMETAGIIAIKQYKAMCKSKLGPSVAVLDRWLKGMGFTWRDWIDAYEGTSARPALRIAEDTPPYQVDGHVMIPKLDVRLAAGSGGSGTERIEKSYAFDRSWIKGTLKANLAELRLVDVTGHSMEPTYCKGDLVLVDMSRRKLLHDHIYAFRTPDGPIIKRLCKAGKTWHLHSDNHDREQYPDQPVAISELEIIGEVLWGAGRRN